MSLIKKNLKTSTLWVIGQQNPSLNDTNAFIYYLCTVYFLFSYSFFIFSCGAFPVARAEPKPIVTHLSSPVLKSLKIKSMFHIEYAACGLWQVGTIRNFTFLFNLEHTVLFLLLLSSCHHTIVRKPFWGQLWNTCSRLRNMFRLIFCSFMVWQGLLMF